MSSSNISTTVLNNKSFEKLPPLPESHVEVKPKEVQTRNSIENLKNSTVMELRLEEEIHSLKKQMNQKENEYKKDKAVLEQNIDLLKLQIQEYKKREENLKKMNETIMNSLNDIANQGNNSKIFKEIQLNYEQHNKELVESKTKLQLTINNLENENRTLKDQINEMKLQIKDLEITIEKEKINNERAYEVNYLDRTQMENDLQKQQLITEEGFQQTKFALETKIQEINFQKDQQMLEQREKYEEKMRQMQLSFDKEKNGLEQRIQKNLNTIRKYQTHIEQNVSVNTSSFLGNQSKMDISSFKSETDVELRAEILKLNTENQKINLDLQHQVQQTYAKDEQIIKQQQKITELNKQIDDLKSKLSFYENAGDISARTFVSSNNLQIPRDGGNTPQQQSPIQINRTAASQIRNSRSVSTNQFNQNANQNQNSNTNTNMPLQIQAKGLRDSLKQSQVKQRISNVNYNQGEVLKDLKSQNIYQSQFFQNGLSDTQFQDYDNSLENINIQIVGAPQNQNQYFQQSQQILPNNIYMQLQQQMQMSQDGIMLHDAEQQQQLQQMYTLQQQSANSHLNQNQNMNYVAPFQNDNQNADQFGENTQLFNQYVNENYSQRIDGQQPFTPNQDKFVNFINNQQEDFNDGQNENRKRNKKNMHEQQDNRQHSPINNNQGQYKNQIVRNSQILRNQSASPIMINDIHELAQNDRSLQNITNQSQFMIRNASNNNINNNYKTLLLCENCGQCFMPNDLVDHMTLCNPQLQQQLNMTQQNHQSIILDKTQLMQQQQQQSDEQSENFYKVINQLNYEKQLVEQKLYILENHLQNTQNANGIVAQDRDRLKQELDNIMLELGKAKMNQVVQSEEQVACTVALKNEIKFLINKLLKAKGKLSESNNNLNQTQNIENMSYFNDQLIQSAQGGFNQKLGGNRKDYSSFSIKGCVDFNTYSNNMNQSQCLVDSSCLRDSNFINPNAQKKSQLLNQRSINNMSNISQNSYF